MKRENNLIVWRTKHKENFKVIDLTCFQDKNLSWKAKGIFSYLISRPDGWEINMSDLRDRSIDGVDSIYSGLDELLDHKYVFRITKKNEKSQIVKRGYFVTEIPKTIKEIIELTKPFGYCPDGEKPDREKPYKGNPALSNKDSNNEEINNKLFLASKEAKGVVINSPSQHFSSGIKISRENPKLILKQMKKKTLSSKEDFLSSNQYSQRAKQLLVYWNDLPAPIKHFQLTHPLSKICVSALDSLEHVINQGYTDDQIKFSFHNYQRLLAMKNCKLFQNSAAVNMSLGDFIRPAVFFKKKMEAFAPNVQGWFYECLPAWEMVYEKYCKEKKDAYPDVTIELKAQLSRYRDKKFTMDEENILRVVAKKGYNYFMNLKDFKEDISHKKKYPATCMNFVVKYLAEKTDFCLDMIPGWVQADSFFNGDLTAYLREIGYIQDGWDSHCEAEEQNEQDYFEMERQFAIERDREARAELGDE
jgi:hypothetical protein